MTTLLKPAIRKIAYAKVGIYGSAGSGKTRTATEIAIGLHNAIGSTKPIAVFDTEPAFSFMIPICERNGIELLISDESRALKDLMQFLDEAEQASDIAIIDSISHIWRDAQKSFLEKVNMQRRNKGMKTINQLEFHHWKPIKDAWAKFTDRFLSSKLHIIVCGRSGTVYEYQDKDDGSGKKELISTGTRMATEKELGYEPSLLIEMVLNRESNRSINTAVIQKDRADVINGAVIPMPNYESLRGHFNSLNLGGKHFDSMEKRNSVDMYEVEEMGWDKEKHLRTVYTEEIEELLKAYYPSTSVADRQQRFVLLEEMFNTRSWTNISNMSSETLQSGLKTLRQKLETKLEELQQAANA